MLFLLWPGTGSFLPPAPPTPCGPGYMPLLSAEGQVVFDADGNFICVPYTPITSARIARVPFEIRRWRITE